MTRERQRYQEVHAGQLNCGDVIETFLVEKRKEILQEKIQLNHIWFKR